MKRALLTAALLAAYATSAGANGLQLAWTSCAGTVGATKTIAFDCDPNAGTVYELFGTFSSTTAMTGVVAMDGITDLRFEGQTDVPPFWQFQLFGCNETGLNMIDARPASCSPTYTNTICGNGGGACDGVITAFGLNYKGPGTGRLLFTLARASVSPTDLAAEPTKHFAFDLQFFMDHAGDCAGCNSPVSMVWNMAVLYNTLADAGQEGTAGILSSTDAASDPCVNMNGGTLAGCNATPTKRNTWGQLKTLYR